GGTNECVLLRVRLRRVDLVNDASKLIVLIRLLPDESCVRGGAAAADSSDRAAVLQIAQTDVDDVAVAVAVESAEQKFRRVILFHRSLFSLDQFAGRLVGNARA